MIGHKLCVKLHTLCKIIHYFWNYNECKTSQWVNLGKFHIVCKIIHRMKNNALCLKLHRIPVRVRKIPSFKIFYNSAAVICYVWYLAWMHEAAFFASGRDRVEQKKKFWGGAGRGKSQTRGIFGVGQSWKFSGPGQPFFPGPGRGGLGRASLVSCSKTIFNKLLRDVIVIRITFPIDWQCFRVCDIEQSWSKNNCLFAPSRALKTANI